MIYVRLVGGLGNQLFQYACGRALALRHGAELLLDLRELSRGAAHAVYGLGSFSVQARIATAEELPPPRSRLLAYGLWRSGLTSPRFLREQGLGLNPAVLSAPAGTYLHGYFQSEGYFADAVTQIRSDLELVAPAVGANAEWLARIADDERAVSVHVRRGDYAAVGKAQAAHGTCGPDYYRDAVALLRNRLGLAPRYYVFSDDPEWARSNLHLDGDMQVLDHNPPSAPVEDLRLMGACRHHIIANSSFSWWGGWRNPSPDKLVIAPARWFADPKLKNPDICPAGWLRV